MATWIIEGEQQEQIRASGPLAAWRKLLPRLSVAGPRTIRARGPGQSEVVASLYDEQDRMVGVRGQRVPWPRNTHRDRAN
jgi:hypothetical protein